MDGGRVHVVVVGDRVGGVLSDSRDLLKLRGGGHSP